jgi:ketosteroid isomerase-like protein
MRLERAALERHRKGDALAFGEIGGAPFGTYFDARTPQRVDGQSELKGELAQRPARPPFDVMEFIEPRAQVHGDAVVLFYRFLATNLRPDGTVAQRRAWSCTEVYARLERRWRIVHSHWSWIGARPPVPSETE